MTFTELGLSEELENAFASLNYAEPFPVQIAVIPEILKGSDLLVQAQTGSGKTVAFLSPLLHSLSTKPRSKTKKGPKALIIVPTRELAAQIEERAIELVKFLTNNVKIRVVFGGVSINPQMLSLLGGADVLIATPGRLLDIFRQNAFSFNDLETLVLDEADKLLDQGFVDELNEIKSLLPAKRQTIFFSATLNSTLKNVLDTYLINPKSIIIEQKVNTETPIEELVYFVEPEAKGPFLRTLLEKETWQQVLIFVNSAKRADNVVRKLDNNGIKAMAIHGEKTQGARTDAILSFRGSLRILVATDILARGIDVTGLDCVINYELPRSAKDYTHRIGRTGRALATGLAISLVSPDEEAHLALIEKKVGRRFPKSKV